MEGHLQLSQGQHSPREATRGQVPEEGVSPRHGPVPGSLGPDNIPGIWKVPPFLLQTHILPGNSLIPSDIDEAPALCWVLFSSPEWGEAKQRRFPHRSLDSSCAAYSMRVVV